MNEENRKVERFGTAPTSYIIDGGLPGSGESPQGRGVTTALSHETPGGLLVEGQTVELLVMSHSDLAVEQEGDVSSPPPSSSSSSPFVYSHVCRHQTGACAASARDDRYAAADATDSGVCTRRSEEGDVELGEIVVVINGPTCTRYGNNILSIARNDDNATTTPSNHITNQAGDDEPTTQESSSADDDGRYCRICVETVSFEDLDSNIATRLGCACVSGRGPITPSDRVAIKHIEDVPT